MFLLYSEGVWVFVVKLLAFCWPESGSGPELNWHWQRSVDQFNSMVNEIFSRDRYQQVPDFVGWSRKIHVCCCEKKVRLHSRYVIKAQ